MYEINVLSMDEGQNGDYTMLGDGLKLPADKETVSKFMAASRVSEDVIPFTAFEYQFRMETMNQIVTGSQRLAELNYLAQRLYDLSELERWTYKGAVQLCECKTPADCINLTYNLDEFALYPHISNEEQLGHYFVEHDLAKLNSLPPEFLKHLDYELLGRRMSADDKAVFIGGHYIRNMEHKHNDVYDGIHIPDIRENDTCILKIRIASASEPDGTWLKFPLQGYIECIDEIDNCDDVVFAKGKLHARSLPECSITSCVCKMPVLESCIETHKDLSLKDFIWIADYAAVMIEQSFYGDAGNRNKCYAALEYEHCTDLDFATDISQNLPCYDLLPVMYADPKTYGQLILAKRFKLLDEQLLECFDMEALGKDAMALKNVSISKFGVISRNDTPFTYEYFTPPSNEMQMR